MASELVLPRQCVHAASPKALAQFDAFCVASTRLGNFSFKSTAFPCWTAGVTIDGSALFCTALAPVHPLARLDAICVLMTCLVIELQQILLLCGVDSWCYSEVASALLRSQSGLCAALAAAVQRS